MRPRRRLFGHQFGEERSQDVASGSGRADHPLPRGTAIGEQSDAQPLRLAPGPDDNYLVVRRVHAGSIKVKRLTFINRTFTVASGC